MNPSAPKKKVTLILRVILLLAFFASIFFAFYFYRQYQSITNEQEKVQKEISDLKNAISKILIVPEEDPVIATVTDKTKLEQQAFFRQAENGDKVVIYQSSGKAILYRPSVNKIVDITVINVGTENKAQVEQINKITLSIYNGTTTSGMAAQIQKAILENVQNIDITNLTDAARKDYEKTLIVINNENAKAKADEIATLLNAELSSLPQEENNPNTDLIIILGSDSLN